MKLRLAVMLIAVLLACAVDGFSQRSFRGLSFATGTTFTRTDENQLISDEPLRGRYGPTFSFGFDLRRNFGKKRYVGFQFGVKFSVRTYRMGYALHHRDILQVDTKRLGVNLHWPGLWFPMALVGRVPLKNMYHLIFPVGLEMMAPFMIPAYYDYRQYVKDGKVTSIGEGGYWGGWDFNVLVGMGFEKQIDRYLLGVSLLWLQGYGEESIVGEYSLHDEDRGSYPYNTVGKAYYFSKNTTLMLEFSFQVGKMRERSKRRNNEAIPLNEKS